MDEQHVKARLIALLRRDQIRLWLEPYTTDARGERQELADRYSAETGLALADVTSVLELIRSEAVMKGEGNKEFKESNIATLELHLPKAFRELGRKVRLKSKLNISTQELMKLIHEEYGIEHCQLIVNGKKLDLELTLEQQQVRNNSKLMLLSLSREQQEQQREAEQQERQQEERVRRTEKGFQILSERDGSEDPDEVPFLEIADQKGNPLQIPAAERKALILAMGFHEKGRALMKRRDHGAALCHLLLADREFKKCESALLQTVDNWAVLQLDVVWCYRLLEELQCLGDAHQRLRSAEECFLLCYGHERSRLRRIKGQSGGEDVLFLRLYLLQALVFYLDGHAEMAKPRLQQAELLFSQLCLDPVKMACLRGRGFSEQEARLGLRACAGDVEEAERHITRRKREREERERREQERRRRRLEGVATLHQLGFSKRAAEHALQCAAGNVDRAYGILLDRAESQDTSLQEQLVSLGFEQDMAEAALRRTGGDLQQATQMLLDHQGIISPDLRSPSPPSSSSSTSSSASSSSLDQQLVKEVLEDIPQHEEDYLDLTLDEEKELMEQIRSLLNSH